MLWAHGSPRLRPAGGRGHRCLSLYPLILLTLVVPASLIFQARNQHAAMRTVQLDRARLGLLGRGGGTQKDSLPCLETRDGLREPDQSLSYITYVPYQPFG